MTLTFGSLFAGIGGFDLGFERAGMVCKWQVEIDDYCNRVLTKHWPDVQRYRDVRDCGAHNLESVDVICGGFPCQDISLAGGGAGIDGNRSGLWREFSRIIRELRPRFAVVENVAALLGRGLGRVLGDLAASGYDAEWQVLPAVAFGLPHVRERVYIVAYPNGDRRTGQAGARVGGGQVAPLIFTHQAAKSLMGIPVSLYPPHWAMAMADGIPAPVDELRALGNAVVPQATEWIGRQLVKVAE